MSTRTFRYCKDTGKMVEVTRDVKKPVRAFHSIDDMKPYQVVGPEYGLVINSRSRHREYLRRHNLIEAGNERKYFSGRQQPE